MDWRRASSEKPARRNAACLKAKKKKMKKEKNPSKE